MPRSNYSSDAEYRASKGDTRKKDLEAAYDMDMKKKPKKKRPKMPTGGYSAAIGGGT